MHHFTTFLLLGLFIVGGGAQFCDSSNFRNVASQNSDDYLIYGITQDCQMFFLRPSQLHLLSTIRIDKRHSFCYANLIQLHLKAYDTLLLTLKQATNRICTLEVHIPPLDMLFGDHLFRYSLINSLPYVSCSHSTDQSFQLEPDLSFMDPIYNDIIYFIDSFSNGPEWKTIQFRINDTGSLKIMNNLTISNSKDLPASEFVISIDSQRDKVYRRNRFDNQVDYQCSFDMLFRPKKYQAKQIKIPERGYGNMLNSQSVEGDLMVFVETDRTTNPSRTNLNILNINNPEIIYCLVSTSFTYDVGIIHQDVLEKFKSDPFPPFGTPIHQKTSPRATTPPTKSPSKNDTKSTKSVATKSTKMILNPTKQSKTDPYSPSKSFFNFESASQNRHELSNEIPVEQIEKKQDEEIDQELGDIIKELDGIGELRTSETITRDVKINVTADIFPNSTDHAAIKASRNGIENFFIIFCLCKFLNYFLLF